MFNPIMTAALRMSSVNLNKRIINEGEIFYEHIKTMNPRFYFYFNQDHLKSSRCMLFSRMQRSWNKINLRFTNHFYIMEFNQVIFLKKKIKFSKLEILILKFYGSYEFSPKKWNNSTFPSGNGIKS